VTDMNGVL